MKNMKDILGDFYLDINNYNLKKKDIIRTINNFINTNTLITSYSDESKAPESIIFFKKFAEENNLTLLNLKFLSYDIPNSLYEPYSSKRICLAYDNKSNEYKILISRSSYGGIKVLDEKSRLSLDVIKDIYKCFVYKIGDYKYNIRKIKEILCLSKKLKGFCYKINYNDYNAIKFIKDIIINYDSLSITIKTSNVYVGNGMFSIKTFDDSRTYDGIKKINQVVEKINENSPYLIKDTSELFNFINVHRNELLNNINLMANNSIEYINNNFKI